MVYNKNVASFTHEIAVVIYMQLLPIYYFTLFIYHCSYVTVAYSVSRRRHLRLLRMVYASTDCRLVTAKQTHIRYNNNMAFNFCTKIIVALTLFI